MWPSPSAIETIVMAKPNCEHYLLEEFSQESAEKPLINKIPWPSGSINHRFERSPAG